MRVIKRLGLTAVLAAAAVMCLGVSLAGAAEFKAESVSTKFEATSTGGAVFSLPNAQANCAVTFSPASGSTPDWVATGPSFSACSVGGVSGTGKANGCGFLLGAPAEPQVTGSAKIACPTGAQISITAGGCTVSVGNQADIQSITYTNKGSGSSRTIAASASLSGITYKSTCLGTKSNGTLSISWVISGKDEVTGEKTGVWLESTKSGPNQFHVEEWDADLSGTHLSPVVAAAAGSTLNCKTASFVGTFGWQNQNQIVVHPSLGSCSFMFVNTTVNTGGCDFIFHISGSVDIGGAGCAASPITYKAAGCTVTIGPQSGVGTASYTNKGSGQSRSIAVAPTLSGLAYTSSGSCLKTGSFSNGTYSGEASLTASNVYEQQQGLFVG